MASSSCVSPSARHSVTAFCWQGWQLELPARWNPVKVEGDYQQGAALIADLHRPRLGLRWKSSGKIKDLAAWARRALSDEVGRLAADEAKPLDLAGGGFEGSTLYVEPDPPGRDVWVARSTVSGRCIEVIHHAHRREAILARSVLPRLRDLPLDQPMRWSVFDLSCVAPAGMKLASHRLNAGDLGLTFARGRAVLTIRQISVAELALRRMSIERWLEQQEQMRRHFRAAGDASTIKVACADGRVIEGLSRAMHRRRRFFFMRRLPRQLVTAVLHDRRRDRLVIVQASDEPLLREAAAGVGWAADA